MIKEIAKTTVDTTLFGAIGYGCAELVKIGANAFRASKLTYFAQEPLFVKDILSINSLQIGATCALFVLVDTLAKKVFDKMLEKEADLPLPVLGRVVTSIAVTSLIATAVGLTSSVAVASGVIVVSMSIYALIQKLATAYNWGRYENIKEAVRLV